MSSINLKRENRAKSRGDERYIWGQNLRGYQKWKLIQNSINIILFWFMVEYGSIYWFYIDF